MAPPTELQEKLTGEPVDTPGDGEINCGAPLLHEVCVTMATCAELLLFAAFGSFVDEVTLAAFVTLPDVAVTL